MLTTIMYAHGEPERSRVNERFLGCIKNEPDLYVHDLTSTYRQQDICLGTELAILEKTDTIVFQFPLYWYSVPSILKLWLDTVFGSESILRNRSALSNKSVKAVTTAGSQLDFENQSAVAVTEHLFWPLKQTTDYFGMNWHAPLIFDNVCRWSDRELAQACEDYAGWLTGEK